MKTTFRHALFLSAFVFFGWSVASAQTSRLMWDETSSPPVNGYSVTVDGLRIDYQLTPAGANGACGCSIPLPFSGGIHTVVVGAYNPMGETLSAPLVVAPVANAGGPYAGQAGVAVAVNGSGSSDPTGTITAYSWNWGDGTSAQGSSAQASHTYASAGAFTITLTITDTAGATASATTTATISGGTPALPSVPSNPSPASGSTGVTTFPTLPTLTWSSAGATTYTINFGTTNPPPQAATGITSASFAPASLLAGATYYWQVIARNTGGSTTGPVWWFTTAATTTPTVTARTPASGATSVSTATTVTATFSEAMAAATIASTTVRLSSPSSVQVASTVTYNATTRTVTLTPTAALANATTYTAVVKAGVTNLAGNPMTSDATWSFTTAAAVPPPALPGVPGSPNPANAATGTSTTATLTWSAAGATSYTVNFGTSNPPPQAASITGASYTPTLVGGKTYFWQIIARNSAGATTGPVWSFTTAAPPPTTTCPCSLWTLSTTPGPVDSDTSAVELGLKFTSDISGFATGVRFYKYAQNTGTHIGHLWTAGGTLLATVTFTGETASGWQQATFATPVAITANTTYVVSYHTDKGRYAATAPGLTAGVNRAPLHAPSNSTAGGNGVYRYGATTAFPNQTWNASNYWVDVVIRP